MQTFLSTRRSTGSKCGIYKPNCGRENVHMSFGHDGYIAEVMKPYLSGAAIYMLPFHSFYAWHRHGAYQYLENEKDKAIRDGFETIEILLR